MLSEFKSAKPDLGLIEWLESIDETATYLSTVTIGELRYGIARLAQGRKRNELDRWLVSEILPSFGDRILAPTVDVADAWGRIRAKAADAGRTLSPIDALIAATAVAHNLSVVTRNVDDFPKESALINPWSDGLRRGPPRP